MHARRTRIKGIANIPQRRKINSDDIQIKSENVASDSQSSLPISKECAVVDEVKDLNSSQVDETCKIFQNVEPSAAPNKVSGPTSDTSDDLNNLVSKDSVKSEFNAENYINNTVGINNDQNFTNEIKSSILEIKTQGAPARRKFIKPPVSLSRAANRKVEVERKVAPIEDESNKETAHVITASESLKAVDLTAQTKSGYAEKNPNIENQSGKILEEDKPQIAPQRRKFIKPAVSLSKAVNRKAQVELKDASKDEDSNNAHSKEFDKTSIIDRKSVNACSPVDLTGACEVLVVKDEAANTAHINSERVDKNQGTGNQSSNFQEVKPHIALQRRKFIKPAVSLPRTANRKVDIEAKPEKESSNQTITDGEIKPMLIEEDSDSLSRSSLFDLPTSTNTATLNEVSLFIQNDHSNLSVETGNLQKKPVTIISSNHLSDSEYPPPPPSPSKINRSRIKAVPRLGYRKASFSASESEDESRRNSHRIRNDSVCSTTSMVADSMSECFSPMRPKESAVTVAKKIARNEQTRKVAEARLEFRRKFGFQIPDRQRLTMMDLIFYNPVTNPIEKVMTPTEKVIPADEEAVDEIVDDPQDEGDKDDDEKAMPVPQIKIGPSGEIMLDEKSLVVERKGLKRQIEEIEKSKIVDGDKDTSYGIYKRHKRAAKWSASETVRFYRALNTLGTDFELMVDLFPNRTRRDLKLKFNREEKTNRMLIDKALMQPCQYAFESLKLDMEREIRIQDERQKQIDEDSKMREERKLARKKLKEIKEETEDAKPPKIRKKSRKQELSIKSVIDDSDADVSDIGAQSGSEDELVLSQNSTRSGRQPKVTKKFQPEPTPVKKATKKYKARKKVEEEIEPGSIMIVNELGPNNEPVYKIFMVTPDHHKTPIELPSEDLSKLMQFKKGVKAQNILTISVKEDENAAADLPPVENNMTIVEDASVTSLKSNPLPPSESSVASVDDCIVSDTDANQVIISDNTIVEDGSVTTKNYLTKIEEKHIGNDMTIIEDNNSVTIVRRDSCLLNKDVTTGDNSTKHNNDVKTEIKDEISTSRKNVNISTDEIIVLDSGDDTSNVNPDNIILEDNTSTTANDLTKMKPLTIIEDDTTVTFATTNKQKDKDASADKNTQHDEDVKPEIKVDMPTARKNVNVISNQIIVLGVDDTSDISPEESSSASGNASSKEGSVLSERKMSDILKYIIDGKGVALRLTKTEETDVAD